MDRKIRLSSAFVAVCVAAALAAAPPPPAYAKPVSPNPAPDTSPDAEPDTSPDTSPDSTPDDSPDATPDWSPSVTPDESPTPTPTPSPRPGTQTPAPRTSPPSEAPAGCDILPKSGPGSRGTMKDQQVVAALSGVPELSTFVSAINQASYAATFDNSNDITVFVPVNSAFDDLPEGELDKVLADREKLVALLGYHVVQGRKTPADLADATLTTKQTGSITTKTSDDTITVNGTATVLCPDIQTHNANVYLIDKVLEPPS